MTQPWSPEREAEIREWLTSLGSGKSAADVGPYTALLDTLAELDRLRAELASEREDVAYLHRNTIADLRRAAQGHLDGKKRWRERAEKAEAELTAVEESATRTRLADMDAPQPTPGRDARYELYAALTYPQWNPATNSHSTGDEKAEHLIDAHRAQVLAEGLTAPEHQLLTYALELAKEEVAERGTGFDADSKAVDSLCGMADAFAERKATR